MLRRLCPLSLSVVVLLSLWQASAWGQVAQLINGNRTHAGATNYGVTTGAANAYVLTLNAPIPAYAEGSCYWLELHAANTGAATLNVNGQGAKAILKYVLGAATPLAANDFVAGQLVEVCYDGVSMQAQLGGGGSGHLIQDEGTGQPQRPNLNFVGAGVTCDTQDGSTTRCTITGGGGGGSLILDLADNGTNESGALGEIATVGDPNGIFSLGATDKLLINVGLDWPKADLADALAGTTTNCPLGQLAGGISATGAAEDCTDVVTQGELSTHANTTTAVHGSTALNTPNTLVQRDGLGNFAAGTITAALIGNASTATAFPSNPANCTNASDLAAGITATGAAEGCIDVATQLELNAHANTTTAVHGSTAANTPNTLVQRDLAGNFSAAVITATTFSGNATTASGLNANPANCTNATDLAAGITATGAAEGCIDVATQAELNTALGLKQDLVTWGAGLQATGATASTASGEANFLADGGVSALTCGAANQGKMQVMDNGELQYCDGATTSVLRSGRPTQTDLVWNVTTTSCTGDPNGGTLTVLNNEIVCQTDDSGAGGGPILVDFGDNGSNEITALTEITVLNDTNSVFSVPSANKLQINLALDWPKADQADALAANPANCTNATDLAAGINAAGVAEGCVDVATQAELNAALPLKQDVVTWGAGLQATGATASTASTEAAFLADGGASNLTCGAVNQGKMQVMDSGELQYCDGATTSVLRSGRPTQTGLSWNVTPASCTGDPNGGVLTVLNNEIVCQTDDSGAGGGPILVDFGDNGSNEITALTEITVLNDPNSVFSVPSANKLQINLALDWPKADQADALAANPLDCPAGEVAAGITATGVAEGCVDVATQVELTTGLATKATIVGTPTALQLAEWTSATSIQGVGSSGTGSVVRQVNASLTTANLGIPTAIDLTNATNLPLAQVPKVVRAAMAVSLARLGGF